MRKIIQSSTLGKDKLTNDLNNSGEFKREGIHYLSETLGKYSYRTWHSHSVIKGVCISKRRRGWGGRIGADKNSEMLQSKVVGM